MMPASKVVIFNGKEYNVKKMPLRRFDEFAQQLDRVIKGVRTSARKSALLSVLAKVSGLFRSKKEADLFGEYGELGEVFELVVYNLRTAPEGVAKLLEVATQIPTNEIMDAPAEDVISLAVEVWELNNLVRIFKDALKKVMASVQEADAGAKM